MASATAARLSELVAGKQRLALVGLAKNTGKTETLSRILAEHLAAGRPVGVTSIGRDGEEHDVLDARIDKPRVRLPAGSLVASTDELLRASGVEHELLLQTGVRTPLGEVFVSRLGRAGTVEVAGPSAAADVRAVCEAMIELGAEQVLIDGAIDRRAASSPAVADGLVMATGAVLAPAIEDVVAATVDAVELVKLPLAKDAAALRSASAGDARTAPARLGSDGEVIPVGRGLVLGGEPAEIAALLLEHPRAHAFLVDGALSERLLEGLLAARRERAGRELRILARDPTRVFLSRRGAGWYRRQGLAIEVLDTIDLRAITVNPLAPQSHRFDSRQLRELIQAAVGEVPVLDVLDPAYPGGG